MRRCEAEHDADGRRSFTAVEWSTSDRLLKSTFDVTGWFLLYRLNETNQMNRANHINGMNKINTEDHELGGCL